ncbi:MAG: hypothetical protein II668_08635 [Oscillospiraceae bacterium]|nr:hypothetical protein [Oscillospiraceae bacterium]
MEVQLRLCLQMRDVVFLFVFRKFKITERGLRPPFVAISGLGETAARDIVEQRKLREFVSIEELGECCPKVSKTHIEQLKALGALSGLPETSQMSLF